MACVVGVCVREREGESDGGERTRGEDLFGGILERSVRVSSQIKEVLL